MSGRRQCEFFLVRYVADPVRNEFVNIGVLLREADGAPDRREPLLRFTRDWARVRCADPDVDTQMLEALEAELSLRLVDQKQTSEKPLLDLIKDSFSNTLQITEGKACLAESMNAEIESLMRVYVDSPKRQSTGKKSGRAAIHAKIRMQFERAGVWAFMRKRVFASTYTRAGDLLRIDCAYRPNGVIRMFHAVSVEGDTDSPKVLAFSMPAIREGVARVEKATLDFTAVVESLAQVRSYEGDEAPQYSFGVETMEAAGIRVITTNDLPRVAQLAQTEMRIS